MKEVEEKPHQDVEMSHTAIDALLQSEVEGQLSDKYNTGTDDKQRPSRCKDNITSYALEAHSDSIQT